MIVPRNRLLFWAGAVVLPFATLAGVFPAWAVMSWAVMGAFVLGALLDAAFSRRDIRGVRPEFPEVVRLSRGREGLIAVTVKNETGKGARIRLGLPLPQSFVCGDEDILFELPPGSGSSRFSWPCTPGRRGSYLFRTAYLELPSRLGFWDVRAAVEAPFEVRVYPDLRQEWKRLAALFLNRGRFGLHAQRRVGQGRDFEKLREYERGDSYDSIHWKATAKRGRPITKVYQIERTQEVYVAVDASRLSGRPVTAAGEDGESILDRFLAAALLLGVVAERQGDLFGLVTFSDRVHHFVRAGNGRAHFGHCRDALYMLEPRIVSPDYDEFGSFVSTTLSKRALVFILTSLDDPVLAEGFMRSAPIVRRKHVVRVAMLRPQGANAIFSGPEAGTIEDIYRHLGGHLLWHRLREVSKMLEKKGIGFSLLGNKTFCSQLISQYLAVKERQLL
jgi:uncharacterized protein (DUF58 family)